MHNLDVSSEVAGFTLFDRLLDGFRLFTEMERVLCDIRAILDEQPEFSDYCKMSGEMKDCREIGSPTAAACSTLVRTYKAPISDARRWVSASLINKAKSSRSRLTPLAMSPNE